MELIEESKRALYDKCKYLVKRWEVKFIKEKGRLPSKLDIRESPVEVREAYKTYFKIKSAALEQSFSGIEGFNLEEDQADGSIQEIVPAEEKSSQDLHLSSQTSVDLQDEHLNKSDNQMEEEPCPWDSLPKTTKSNDKLITKTLIKKPNLEITKRLFVGSKFTKRNPRKSLQAKSESSINLSRKVTSEDNIEKPVFLSQCEPRNLIKNNVTSSDIATVDEDILPSLSLPTKIITKISKPANIQSTNILNRDTDLNKKPLKNIDINWLNRIQETAQIKESEEFNSEEDIVESSEDEREPIKKIKLSHSPIENKEKENQVDVDHIPPIFSKDSQFIQNFNINHVDKKTESEASTVTREANNETKTNIIQENKEKYEQESSKTDSLAKAFKNKNLNENFRKINIEKKVYVRGKKQFNLGRYKKSQWKAKKQFMEKQDGEPVIFNRFKRIKGDELLPLDALGSDDEDVLADINLEEKINLKEKLSINKETKKPDDQEQEILEMEIHENKQIDDMTQKSRQVKNKPAVKKKKETSNNVKNTPKRNKTVTPKNPSRSTRSSVNYSEKSLTKQKIKTVDKNICSDNSHEIELENDKVNNAFFNDEDGDDLLLETLRIENALDMEKVEPLYQLKENGELIDTPLEVFEALKMFGHSKFRNGQEKAIMRILSGQSTLVTQSTGSGKSLCYQISAYLYRKHYKKCITLVISPLVSLMEDQVKCAPSCLKIACLHNNMPKAQKDLVMKSLGEGEVGVLLISPEAIVSSEQSGGFGSILTKLPSIAFACLDEAHCLSQWSHNFRPSYLVLCRILSENLGIKVFLGLTATATKSTKNSLIEQLNIKDGENGIITSIPVPNNLTLSVSKVFNRDQALIHLLTSEPLINYQSIIIYCMRRELCEKVASFLRTSLKDEVDPRTKKRKRMSWQAEPYHAGLTGARRMAVQKAFMSGELRIVVATIAFGMGINKADIRAVIHYNMPGKFESYVQEIGRAGRDGLQANCHAFLDKEDNDFYELKRHINANNVDRHMIRKLLKKVFVPCLCKDTCTKHEVIFSVEDTVRTLDLSEEIIMTLFCYLELNEKKLVKILRHTYVHCKIISYRGFSAIIKASGESEVLRKSLELFHGEKDEKTNIFEFPILDVAKELNHDTGMCKKLLKNLEWETVNGEQKRSCLTVEFKDLGFHLLAPGNLMEQELDEALDDMYSRVVNQQKTSHSKLQHIYQTLETISRDYKSNSESISKQNEALKESIRGYFDSDEPDEYQDNMEISADLENRLIGDIRCIINRYSDTVFTGRSIARIFHGIASPNFPPFLWGKCSFWRSYIKVSFDLISKIATKELVGLR